MFNKVKTAINRAQQIINNTAQNVDQYSGVGGVISQTMGASTPVDGQGAVAVTAAGLPSPAAPRVLTWQDAKALAGLIDDLNVGSNHLAIKTTPLWRQVYLYAPRYISYVNAAGVLAQKSEPTIPCHNCGVILPLEFLQVDHHMPQAGGEHLHFLKTLRALRLTVGVATGAKGAALSANNLNTLTLAPKARDRTYNHLATPSAANKWTTNDQGTAFLSLINIAGGLADVARMCKNSLLNLVPLCPECNRVKSDYIKPIV